MGNEMISNEMDCVTFGDCLEVMQQIPDASIDAIITDPPYGCMDAHWDVAIDWQAWWQEIRRIRKPTAPTVVFCSGTFCGKLYATNPKEWRYDIIWIKDEATNFLRAQWQPMKKHEKIFVFYAKQPKYNPQFSLNNKPYHYTQCRNNTELYNLTIASGRSTDGRRYPHDVIYFAKHKADLHSTAKPVGLCEYLIKTYTDEGDIVLDPFCGGGAVPVAAVRTGRHFIGIEKDPEWHAFAEQRIKNEQNQSRIKMVVIPPI